MRIYGVEGLQRHIRHAIKLAKFFEKYVRSDNRFEIATEVILGIVCFRIKGDNRLTKKLLNRLLVRKQLYLAAKYHDKIVARFVICSRHCTEENITFAWNEITRQTAEILQEEFYEQLIDANVKSSDEIATRLKNLNMETKAERQNIIIDLLFYCKFYK